jgi:ADP-heptose:LPS heptosyltransferase
MAAGLGVKTVSLFGPVDEKTYGPYAADDKHAIISSKNLPCRPCYKKFKYNECDKKLCLKEITVDEVFQAAEKMIKK